MSVRRSSLMILFIPLISLISLFFFSCYPIPYYHLEVQVEGPGWVCIEPEEEIYEEWTRITLRAYPTEGGKFLSWGGDIEGTEQEITFSIDSSMVVVAYFVYRDPITISGRVTPVHIFGESNGEMSTSSLKRDSLYYQKQEMAPPPSQEMIVGLDPALKREEGKDLLNSWGYKVLGFLDSICSYLVYPRGGKDLYHGIEELRERPEVFYVEENHMLSLQGDILPNDPLYPLQWNLPLIRLPRAWEVSRGSPWVQIAVIDTGVDSEHPDLVDVLDLENAYNFARDSTDVQDDHGHGTHVTGIIAAMANNQEGIAGVMWDSSILPLKVFEQSVTSSWNVAQAILYAAGLEPFQDRDAVHIINLSLGSPRGSETLQRAVEEAYRAGVLLVAASGNNGSSVMYPAAYPEVIAVGSVTYNYPGTPRRADYSCYGEDLNIMAPGGSMQEDSDGDGYPDGILSTLPLSVNSTGYGLMAGTSMAAPHVAGVIGLMLAAGFSSHEVLEIIERTAMDIGPEEEYGQGLMNASWAIHDAVIRVIVGERVGDGVNVLMETTVDAKGGEFLLEGVPPGEHSLMAWVDLRGNGILEERDYFGEVGPLLLEPGEEYYEEILLSPVGVEVLFESN